MDTIIARDMGKIYKRSRSTRPDTLKELIVSRITRTPATEPFWALKNINFRLARGRTLGLIGGNGAGKSTLLRMLGGVGRPDKGSIEVNGHIGALLELGAGLRPDLTGRENLYIGAVVGGLSRREVRERFAEIVSFAELEDFIDSPLRTYSTGMQMRLAFSIAVHTNPEILLVDEVLAVGDMNFQQKCLQRIAAFKKAGCSIVIVSHDMSQITELCDEVLWLKDGEIKARGSAKEVVEAYHEEMSSETYRRTPATTTSLASTTPELRLRENRFGSMEVEMFDLALLDWQGRPAQQITSGDTLAVSFSFSARTAVKYPIFVVSIISEDGELICDLHSPESAGVIGPESGVKHVKLDIGRLDLPKGMYQVELGAYKEDWSYAYDQHVALYEFEVVNSTGTKGRLLPPYRWSLEPEPVSMGLTGTDSA